ncbi:MAG: universal stress protein [Terriglobia bacterium]|jgi:nucleotide-binding universal stress UspA family protein
MPLIQRILCPIDFSGFSVLAFDYAQSVASHYKATLLLQHVVDSLRPYYPYHAFPDSFDEICRKLRANAVEQLQEFAKTNNCCGVHTQSSVQDGDVTGLILEVAEERAVNLIVMGTHGLRGIDHLTLGSVTEKVLRKAPCPVLAVCKPAHDSVTQAGAPHLVEVHRVVCCTDFSEPSEQVLEHAVSLAAKYCAELSLLHVIEHMSSSSDVENETARALEGLEKQISPWARQNIVTKLVVRIGKAYQQIVQLALESQTDLLVMGVRGRHALDLAVFGSTTYRVVQSGPCPVLVVHIAKDREGNMGKA